MSQILPMDAVIIGGGIAGLWLHARLRQQGYQVVLLEKNIPGCAQSLHSQGIIHGGTKYSLNGALSKAASAIGDMPARWQACIDGTGEVDLSKAHVASEYHYMWSKERLTSKLTAFFASRALGDRIRQQANDPRPKAFDHDDFHGNFYALRELVLDVGSVVDCLRVPWESSIFRYDCLKPDTFQMQDGHVSTITLQHRQQSVCLKPRHVILTAGEGNESLLHSMGLNGPAMQRRPLHMVLVRHQYPHPVFAHCIGTGSKPLITITTHEDSQGRPIWYLGGNVAETGVELNPAEQIRSVQTLISEILPWIDLGNSEWRSFLINRAEPRQNALTRPDAAFVHQQGNLITAWPTKLALTPNLVDAVLAKLTPPESNTQAMECLSILPHPERRQNPWEQHFEHTKSTTG